MLYSRLSPAIYFIAIPLLGIYLEKTIIRKDTCTPMSIAGLFTMPRTWKQPKCPSAAEWIKKMWYIYTMEYYLAIKIYIYCVEENGNPLKYSCLENSMGRGN